MKQNGFIMIVPEYIGHREGIQFDILNDCAVLRLYYYKPTPLEISQIQYAEAFEVKALELKDSLYMLFKFGCLPWQDAPYSIHLSKYWTNRESYKEMEELELVIKMIDCKIGTVETLRTVTLKGSIITQIKKAIERQLQLPFDRKIYDENIIECYGKYSTDQMAKMAAYGFRLRKNN